MGKETFQVEEILEFSNWKYCCGKFSVSLTLPNLTILYQLQRLGKSGSSHKLRIWKNFESGRRGLQLSGYYVGFRLKRQKKAEKGVIHVYHNGVALSPTHCCYGNVKIHSLWIFFTQFTRSKPTVSKYFVLLLQLRQVPYWKSTRLVSQHTLQYIMCLWLQSVPYEFVGKVVLSDPPIQILLHVIFKF